MTDDDLIKSVMDRLAAELSLLRGRATNTEELAAVVAKALIGQTLTGAHTRIAETVSAFLLAPTTEKEKE